MTLGARADTAVVLLTMLPLTAHGALAYQHVYGPVSPTALLAFASAPQNGFTVAGERVARDALIAQATLGYHIAQNATASLSYSGSFANRTYDNAIKGQVEVRF